jgi:long-chain fatty acid transport protein
VSARARSFVLLALALLERVAHGNPVDAFGLGSRASAMSSAVTAAVDDSSANYYNPAALVRGDRLLLDIGYRYSQPILNLNGRDVGVDASRGFSVGLVAPTALGKFRFAFGLAVFIPDQRLYRIRSLPFSQPRFVYYDNRIQRMLLSANLAIQIIPGLYIGGGLSFMSRTSGTLGLKGNVSVPVPDDSQLVSQLNVDLLGVRYPQFGILWQATRNLTFGVSYRHSFTLEVEQTFRIAGSVGNSGLPPIVENGYFQTQGLVLDLFQPWQITAGVAARMHRRVLVTFDLTFARWSEFRQPAQNTSIDYDIGMFNGAVKVSPPRIFPSPGFSDIVIPRLGVEWRARAGERLSIDVRGGYSYEPTPAPVQAEEMNLVDNDKHTFSTGVGLEIGRLGVLSRPISIDAHFAVTYLPARAHQKLVANDVVGDYTSSGVVPSLGLTLRLRFE